MQMLTAIQIECGAASILGDTHVSLVGHAFRAMELSNRQSGSDLPGDYPWEHLVTVQ